MKNVLFLALLTAVAASADPSIGTGGVLNAASYAYQGLPNSNIAQGSIFVVFGTGLGPVPPAGASVTSAAFPLPTALPLPDGTSNVTVGGTTVQAFMIYTRPDQIAAVLPSNTPVGTGTITVSYQGKTSPPQPITVAANSVGIFTWSSKGTGPAVTQNFVSNSSLPSNYLTTPAHPGQTAILYVTGLGPVTFDESKAAQTGDVGASDFQLTVGGKVAQVAYHGRSSCCSGLDQINFVVPDVSGCYVSVSVKDGGVYSNISTIAVAQEGQLCSDPTGFSASSLQKINQGGTLSFGGISLNHSSTETSFPTGVPGSAERAMLRAASGGKKNATNTTDSAGASFFKWDSKVVTSQGFSQPSIGSCTVYTAKGQSAATDPILPTPLDAGNSVEVKGGPTGATVVMEKSSQVPGFYSAQAPAGFIGAGTFTADNGSGGTDVPGFNVSASFAAPLVWSNKSSITDVTRSAGQLITWTGGATGTYVTISGISFAVTSEFDFLAAAYFVCLAPVEAQQFNVPAWVLETLPTSPASGIAGLSLGSLSVSNYSYTKVTIAPLDEAFFSDSSTDSKSVNYK